MTPVTGWLSRALSRLREDGVMLFSVGFLAFLAMHSCGQGRFKADCLDACREAGLVRIDAAYNLTGPNVCACGEGQEVQVP